MQDQTRDSQYRNLSLEFVPVQLHELHWRMLFKFQAQVAGDLPQGVVKMRKVVDGHVADERAANFIITSAAMQPTEKDEELDDRSETNYDPVGVHGRG